MYDPLVVSTFIEVFDEIAPTAVRAGQLAKSIMVFADDRLSVQTPIEKAIRTTEATRAALAEMRKSVTAAPSIDIAMRRALTHIRQLTPSRVCAIYEYQRERDSFRCTRALGDPSELLTGLVIANGDRITGWAGANRETAVNSDAVLDLGPLAELFDPPLRRTISCPIQLGGQTSAVLTVYCDCEEGFSESHVATLQEATASIALRLKERHESEVLL